MGGTGDGAGRVPVRDANAWDGVAEAGQPGFSARAGDGADDGASVMNATRAGFGKALPSTTSHPRPLDQRRGRVS